MSETTEPTDETADVATTAVDEQQDDPEERTPDDKQAAKFRKQLRQVQEERDQLAERLNTLHRAEAERLATGTGKLAAGSDLWSAGTELAALLDDDGNLSTELVDNAVAAVLESKPHWRKLHPAAPPASTVTSNGKITGGPPAPTWTDVLQQKVDR